MNVAPLVHRLGDEANLVLELAEVVEEGRLPAADVTFDEDRERLTVAGVLGHRFAGRDSATGGHDGGH